MTNRGRPRKRPVFHRQGVPYYECACCGARRKENNMYRRSWCFDCKRTYDREYMRIRRAMKP